MNLYCINNSLVSSQCLCCDLTYFDIAYENSLKLSFNFSLNIAQTQCIERKNYLKRKVLIINSQKREDFEGFDNFNAIYLNIPTSLEQESILSSKYLYSELDFYLQEGSHFIEQEDFNFLLPELFRRTLLIMNMMPFNNSNVNVYFKTNKFFIFISIFLFIKNINFFGNDLIIFNDIIKNNKKYDLICKNEDNFTNPNSICFFEKSRLFKSEYNYEKSIFNFENLSNDNEIYNSIMIIENCNFSNFFLDDKNNGFGSLFYLTHFFGSLMTNNVCFINNFFEFSLLILPAKDFDLFYNFIIKNKNMKFIKQNITFINSKLENQNNYFIANEKLRNFIFMEDFQSYLYFENFTIKNVYSCNLFNLKGIEDLGIIVLKNVNLIDLTQIYINIEFFLKIEIISLICKTIYTNKLINIIGNSNLSISNSYFIDIQSNETVFYFKNISFELENSFFNNLILDSIIYQIFGNLCISNVSFFNILSKSNFFQLENIYSFKILNSFFNNITSIISLFRMQNCDLFSTKSIFIKTMKTSFIFFIENGILSINSDFIIKNNIFDYFHNFHQTNLITIYNSSFISNNIIRKILYKNIDYPYFYFIFIDFHFYENKLLDRYFCFLLAGNLFMNKNILINNFFLDSNLFATAFDLESDLIFKIENSYFENNGVIQKKYIYLSDFSNNLIFFWDIHLASFQNLTFLASKKIELTSGFLSSSQGGDLIEIINNKFILISKNKLYKYKGIFILNLMYLIMKNNIYFNLTCNNMTKKHNQGVVFIAGEANNLNSEYEFQLIMKDNRFYNCECDNGGSMAIIGINYIEIENCIFYNSIAKFLGGTFFIFFCNLIRMTNIYIENSIALKGAYCMVNSIKFVILTNITLKNLITYDSGSLCFNKIYYLEINNLFNNNTYSKFNGGLIHLYSTSGKLIGINSFNSFCEQGGSILYIYRKSNLKIINLFVNNSYSKTSGCISINEAENIIMNKVNIFFCLGEKFGSALYINNLKYFEISDLFLQNCYSVGSGSIYVKTEENDSLFNFINISCISTYSKTGSCCYIVSSSTFYFTNVYISKNGIIPIFIMYNFLIDIYIRNLDINQNSIESSLLYLSGIKINIINSIFRYNCFSQQFIHTEESEIYIYDIKFINNNGFAFLFERSQVQLSEVNINNGNEEFNFYLIQSINSDIFFMNSYIFDLKNLEMEIINFKKGNLIMENIQIREIKGNFLKIQQSNIKMKNILFKNEKNIFFNDIIYENKEYFIYTVNLFNVSFQSNSFGLFIFYGFLKIKILNSYFESLNNENANFLILAINAIDIISLLISKTYFYYFTNSVIKIHTDSNFLYNFTDLLINHSFFLNNSGNIGGSIFINGNFKINIEICLFKNNKAIIHNSSNTLDGIAGCIYFNSNDNINSNFIISSSKFIENYAEKYCSTIFSREKIEILDSILSINNNDNGNFFSYPFSLKLFNDNNDTIFASGTNFELKFELLDYFSNLIEFDNQTILSVKITENIKNMTIKNHISELRLGQINFNHLNIKTNINFRFKLSIIGSFKGFQGGASELRPYTINKEFHFYSRECYIGEIIIHDNMCYKCSLGYFSLLNPMKTEKKYQKCNICPKNAFCFGGNYITPLFGFFRKNENSDNVVPCLNANACLGFDILNKINNEKSNFFVNGECRKGNFGPLCLYCEENYGRNEKNDYCKKCGNFDLIFVKMIFSTFFICFYIFLNYFYAEKKKIKKLDDSLVGNYFKQILNHCQQISIVFISNKPPFDFFNNLINFIDFFSLDNDNVFTNDCLLQYIFYEKENFIILKEFIYTFLPIIFTIICYLFWTLLIIFFKKLNFLKSKPKKFKSLNKLKLFLIISTFVFYTIILRSCFNLLDCVVLDINDSMNYLKKSPEIICGSMDHIKYIMVFGMPGIVIWGMAFPLYLVHILYKNRSLFKTLKRESIKKRVLIHNLIELRAQEQEFRNSLITNEINAFGFFYKDYKKNKYYWEIFIFFRKFFIIFICSVNLVEFDELKIMFLSFVLLTFIHWSSKYLPYKAKEANNLEILSLFSLFFTCIAALNFNSFESVKFLYSISILCLVSNCIFFGYAGFVIGKVFFKKKKEFFLENKKKIKENFNDKKKIIHEII